MPAMASGGQGGVVPGGQQPAQPQQAQQRPPQRFIFDVIRMLAFWYLAMSMFAPRRPSDPGMIMHNLFKKGEPLDMWVYLSEDELEVSDFADESSLIWHEANIPYALYRPESERRFEYTYVPSEAVKRNGSLYVHTYFAKSGYPVDPKDPMYNPTAAFGRSQPLIVYHAKPKIDNRKNLLGNSVNPQEPKSESPVLLKEEEGEEGKGGEEEKKRNKVENKENKGWISFLKNKSGVGEKGDGGEGEREDGDGKDEQKEMEEKGGAKWISYWKHNLTINLVDDFTGYQRNSIPAQLLDFMNFDPKTGNYFPTIFFNDFWTLRDKLSAVNETVESLSLSMVVGPIARWKWALLVQVEEGFAMHTRLGTTMEGESDEIKRVFIEGNPILLGITMIVSMLHTVFDFLAFKNDIAFWKGNKSMEGLSARSVVINFVCQVVVFFYLLDNETSWMIIVSAGIGCAIEFWKIGKAMNITIDISGRFPRLKFLDHNSYVKSKTKEYDAEAMQYLSYALYPLVFCYAIYALMYKSHKSWYSWVLTSLTGCVYTFGFITMCPQLFINYKMKSVAHLPWRQMTYKFLNTIIDDLFAFVIKMPLLHRLSVFRDDIIFFIYLYQRWIYPVDNKRVNEFGFGGEEESERNDISGDQQQVTGGEGVELIGSDSRSEEMDQASSRSSQQLAGEEDHGLRKRTVGEGKYPVSSSSNTAIAGSAGASSESGYERQDVEEEIPSSSVSGKKRR